MIAVFVWGLAGCANHAAFEPVEQISPVNISKARAMQAAEKVLTDMHFDIDKADPEQGCLKTAPLTGAQFFELWRSDNVGRGNTAQANLQTIRRTAELNITEQQDGVNIVCNVNVRRLSLPECENGDTGRVYGLQKLKISDEQRKNMAWVDLGADARLETEILKRIEKQIAAFRKNQ